MMHHRHGPLQRGPLARSVPLLHRRRVVFSAMGKHYQNKSCQRLYPLVFRYTTIQIC